MENIRIEIEDLKAVVFVLPDNDFTALIATLEYEIENWDIKVKTDAPGVMSQLMGSDLWPQGNSPSYTVCRRNRLSRG